MRFIGLLKHEIVRLVSRRRLYLMVVLMTVAGVLSIVSQSTTLIAGPSGVMKPTAPMLFLGTLDQIAFLFIIWPLAVGGTLAEDIGSGLVTLLVTRVGTRGAWLGTKLVAAFAVSLAAFSVPAAVWAVTSACVARVDMRGLAGVIGFGSGLATRHPILLTLFVVLVLALAATTIATLSALVGAITASPVASQIGTSVIYLLCAFALPVQVNPLTRASMLSFSAPWMTPLSSVLYWTAGLLVLGASVFVVTLRRES